MKYVIFIIILLTVWSSVFFSCAKWKDPKAINLNLTNPYCNNPNAVNYNWGFPGKPDSTVCFFPTDLFKGSYMYHDTVYQDTLFIKADSFLLTITALSQTKITVTGFCTNGNSITLTAGPTYIATVDTTIGDSVTINEGQPFCDVQDTLSGTITKDHYDSVLLHINLQVINSTGLYTHSGSAIKQ